MPGGRNKHAEAQSVSHHGKTKGNDRDSVARPDGKAPTHPFPRLDVALTLFGFCYDVFSVSLAVACMVVDVVVGVQLYQGGHTVWAWCVLGVFFGTCAVNVLLLSAVLYDSTWQLQRNLRRRFLVVSISTISHSSITSRNILTSFVLTRKTKEGRKETTKEFLFFDGCHCQMA